MALNRPSVDSSDAHYVSAFIVALLCVGLLRWLFLRWVLLCRPWWPRAHKVAHTHPSAPVSATRVLGLEVYATMPGVLCSFYYKIWALYKLVSSLPLFCSH